MEFEGMDDLNEKELLQMYYDVIETPIEPSEFIAANCYQKMGSSSNC